jgi:hypothetical protein
MCSPCSKSVRHYSTMSMMNEGLKMDVLSCPMRTKKQRHSAPEHRERDRPSRSKFLRTIFRSVSEYTRRLDVAIAAQTGAGKRAAGQDGGQGWRFPAGINEQVRCDQRAHVL